MLEEYNIGIITAIFRKSILKSLPKIFDDRFSIIGDFDLFLRMAKLHYFHYIHVPLASYRIHKKNLSNIYEEKEMDEINLWISENKNQSDIKNLNKLKRKTAARQLLHLKFNNNYRGCLKILFKNFNNILIFKMLIITLTPIYILKKFSRFHT